MQRLEGTAAIVTGASSGIGEATALALASQGASVALVARRRERLENLASRIVQAGGKALVIECDVTDRERAVAAVQLTADAFGRVDVLVNNAGLMLLGPAAEAPVEEWERMVSVNVMGALYMTRAAIPHLIAAAANSPRKVSDIVNISSIAGRRGYAGTGVYSLTKFGMMGFSESLRQELTKRYVRVSTVEPGIVRTELAGHNRPEILAARAKALAEVEPLEVEDIAQIIEFIVTRPRRASVDSILVRPTNTI